MKAATAEYLKERRVEPRMGEERFIRLGEVLATCGKSRSSVYAGIKEGTFCSGQPIPDTMLSFSSTTAGASPWLN